MTGFFVTGTDTGVGKTLIACALLHAFAAAGKSAVGMKPVAAGCEAGPGGPSWGDGDMLRAASTVAAPLELVSPYAFAPPVAPHVAAAQAGVTIDLPRIREACERLRRLADIVIVEGVGGFKVPLNDAQDTADLAKLLELPVILVVGMRLGCINHALLTAQAIGSAKLPLAGWVANRVDPGMAAFEENVQALEARIAAPLLGVVGYREAPEPLQVAGSIEAQRLLRRE